MHFIICMCLGFLAVSAAFQVSAQEAAGVRDASALSEEELSTLTLEELMNVKISSVSKKDQIISNAPAAVFVITQEDIKRSGVTSIPEALRMAPGVQVSQIDANKWAVSARGFQSRFSNKLLVMIDGRTVYTPLFSGTFWENQDLVLEDIEQIEVIRGPGATLWGSNAVNGVINIITKHAKDTQGGLISTRTGTEETTISSLRYGGSIDEDTYYRWYVKYKDIDDLVLPNGNDNADEWEQARTGFRIDSQLTERDSLMVQSNYFYTDTTSNGIGLSPLPPFDPFVLFENETNGFDITSRWNRELDDGSSLEMQTSYTWVERRQFDFEEERHTIDWDFQHRVPLFDNQELIWGAGYRFTTDDIVNSQKIQFFDTNKDLHLFSLFVQDEIAVLEDELTVYLGSKFEHNEFTGFEVQPNARMVWTPNEYHTLWAAVSRAVRTPSRADENAANNFAILPPGQIDNPFNLPVLVRGIAGGNTKSEDVTAFELGYRTALHPHTAVDMALFYNVYDQLTNGEFQPLEPTLFQGEPVLLVPIANRYNASAESYGVEAALEVTLTDWWTVKPAYSYFQVDFENAISFAGISLFEDDQFHQVSLRSLMDLPHNVTLDLWMRYMDNRNFNAIPAYLVVDGRVGWKPKESIEVAAGFQNALDDRHPEFGDSIFEGIRPSEVEHRVYASVTFTF